MTMRRYAIVRDGVGWKIVGGGAAGTHFPSCAAAAFASARLAVEAAENGDEIEVLVQERFGQLRTVTPDPAAYQNAQWPDRPLLTAPAESLVAAVTDEGLGVPPHAAGKQSQA
jgi:hypothetical protein